MAENGNVNLVLGKALSVLSETELLKPVRNLLHRRPSADKTLSVLDRYVGKFTNTRQDRVARGHVAAHRTEGGIVAS